MLNICANILEEGITVVFLILLNFVSYEGALKAGLVFDDHLAIENNPVCNSSAVPITTYVYPDPHYTEKSSMAQKVVDFDATATEYPVESPHSWKAVWYTDFWGNSLSGQRTHLSFRPITTLTYRFDHWITNKYTKNAKPKRKRKVAAPKIKYNGEDAKGIKTESVYEELDDFHDPFRLHLVNIGIHTLNTIFFYVYLCRRYLRASIFASTLGASLFAVHPVHVESVTGIVGRAELLCLFFGLLAFHAYFKYHPVANFTSAQTFVQQTGKRSTTQFITRNRIIAAASVLKALVFYTMFVLCIALGCLSKETGITVAAICLAYDFILIWRHYSVQDESNISQGGRKVKAQNSWRFAGIGLFDLITSRGLIEGTDADIPIGYHPFAFRILSLLTIIGFLQGRKIVLGGRVDLSDSGLIRKVENPFYALPSGLWRKVSFTYLHAKNLQLLLWPYELCCEYGYDCIPAFTTFNDLRVLGIAAMFLFLAFVGVNCFYIPVVGTLFDVVRGIFQVAWNILTGVRERPDIFQHKFSVFDIVPAPRLCLASFWLLVPYLPVSHLLVSVGTNIAERCLYLPSVGICLFAACVCFEMEKHFLRRGTRVRKTEGQAGKTPHASHARGRPYLFYLAQIIIISIIALGVQKTRQRTLDWYTDKSLFESSVHVCPRSAKLNNQLGLSRWNENRILEGKELFEKATAIFPDWSEPHFNLARYYYMTKDTSRTFFHLEHCVTGLYPKQECIDMYFSAYNTLFPNPNATQVLHTAQILEKLENYSQAAMQYRQAGLRFLHSENRSRKRAEFSFNNALRLHNSGKITEEDIAHRRTQQGNRALEENGDLESRCNVLYWLGMVEMYSQNILGFIHHLHKLIRSCVDDPFDRITALQGLPALLKQMSMIVQSQQVLNKFEKGYGRALIISIFGQWIDAMYMHLQGLKLGTKERAEAAETISQAAIDMTRLTFTGDAIAETLAEEKCSSIFATPFTSFFLEKNVSHFGTERMYSSEVQRALRDALYMCTEVTFTADGFPNTNGDRLVFSTNERPQRFNAADFARNKSQNVTMIDDRLGNRSRRCAIYPVLAQTNWRLGDIDEGNAVLDRCVKECTGDVSFESSVLAAPETDDMEKHTARILMSGAQCQEIQDTYAPAV